RLLLRLRHFAAVRIRQPQWIRSRTGISMAAGVVLSLATILMARADTIEMALVQAYQNNPQLNAQRAATRAVDEGVAIALGGYWPRVTATGSANEVYLDTLTRVPGLLGGPPSYVRTPGENAVSTLGATATQTLFNGFQTSNRTRQAEAQVFGARET